MTSFGEMLAGLLDRFPICAGDSQIGSQVQVCRVELELPLEVRSLEGAEVWASMPRGVIATGFDPPIDRLRFRLELAESV